MSDHNPFIRDAFQDDSRPATDRDRLWNTMQHAQARQARARFLMRAGLVLLAGALLAAWAFLRMAPSPLTPIAVNADSISTDSPMEHSMIQDTKEVPSSVIPLLGHRSNLQMEIGRLENRQLELAQMVNQTKPGREHDVAMTQLKSVEQQIEAARIALRVVDAQLAGQPVEVHAAIPPMPPEPPQLIEVHGGGGVPDEVLYAAGGLGTLLVLAMFAMMGYMRRVSRTMRQALTSIEQQVSSQHATLASGIDAIAVEVERLGVGRRFMGELLSGAGARAGPGHRP